MRILIVTPRQPRATGNRITAERHRGGLEALGHRTLVVEPDTPDFAAAMAERFDIVHLLHAGRSGGPWLATGSPLPFVVTLTGTDIHGGLDDPTVGPTIRDVLHRAAAVITQNRLTYAELRSEGVGGDRLRYLPPGIELGTLSWPLREKFAITADATLFLHPAGIRPVKRNLELLLALAPLAAEAPQLRLVFCGPVLEADYGERFCSVLAAHPWAAWAGPLPAAAMADVLRQTDLVLNHSASEGLSNALLEAATLGRPILARDIPGNAAIVEPGSNGLLYRDDTEFRRYARTLLDPAERHRLGRPQPELYDPARESAALLALYRQVLAGSPLTGHDASPA